MRKSQQVTDYWFLGDLLLPPGTGRRNILDRMEQLPISLQVRGIGRQPLACPASKTGFGSSSHLYLTRLCHFVLEEIRPEEIDRMQELPLQILTEVEDWRLRSATICQIRTGGGSWFILASRAISTDFLREMTVLLLFMVIFTSSFCVTGLKDNWLSIQALLVSHSF